MTRSGFRVMEVESGCHVWLGALQSKGYGSAADGRGGVQLAHRLAWEDAHGPIPAGLTIDHLCLNPRCVNVAHMELVTPAENTARGRKLRAYCPRGHEYTPENTSHNSRGWRYCRECHNAARRAARADEAAKAQRA